VITERPALRQVPHPYVASAHTARAAAIPYVYGHIMGDGSWHRDQHEPGNAPLARGSRARPQASGARSGSLASTVLAVTAKAGACRVFCLRTAAAWAEQERCMAGGDSGSGGRT
jgi:hypothetical protein